MSFVPVFVPPPPTRRARQLAKDLEGTIDDFRRQNPGLRGAEVRRALCLVRQSQAVPGGRPTVIAVAVAVALLLVGILFFMRQSTGVDPLDGDASQNWTPLIAVAIVVLAVIAVIRLRR